MHSAIDVEMEDLTIKEPPRGALTCVVSPY